MKQSALEKYSAFIGSIYDCVIEPTRWPDVIGAIAVELRLANGILSLQEMPSGKPLLLATSGLASEWLASVSNYGPEILAAWGGLERTSQFALDEPLVMSHQTPRESWETNRWYSEWIKPQGMFDAVTTMFVREPTMIGSLGFARATAAGEIGEVELAPLRLIGPHVRRAITISRLLDLKSVEAATFASAVDALAAGVVLVDDRLRCLHLNSAGHTLLRAGGPLTVAGGKIAAAAPEATSALAAAVALAARDEAALGRRGIGIPSRDAEGSPFVIHVLPLVRGDIRPGLSRSAVAALFITPAAVPQQIPADALALLYDLTPAETRVLMLVAGGRKQAEIAGTLGVHPSTVKTHLLHVFDKTGCGRQADLVRLVDSLTAPV